MVLVETPIFTRRVLELLSEDEYRLFQLHLLAKADSGPIIRGSGGLRKIRWAMGGRGKSGGVRIIYYLATAQNRILLLFIYAKADQADLTRDQIRQLRAVVDEEFK